jgi:hypothetical protein
MSFEAQFFRGSGSHHPSQSPSHVTVTPVTHSKKGNCISFVAHFSGLSEYASLMIYTSFLIGKNAKYSKKCSAV